MATLTMFACSSSGDGDGDGDDGPPPLVHDAGEDSAWTLFVFQTHNDLEGFVLNQYEYPTRTRYLSLFEVSQTFGVPFAERALLESFLADAYTTAGISPETMDFAVDATGTFATVSLPRVVAEVLYPVLKGSGRQNIAPAVPQALAGVVTHVVGDFNRWCTGLGCHDGDPEIRIAPRPNVEAIAEPASSQGAWDAYPWAMGSGVHSKFSVGGKEVDCPPAPATCTCGFNNPGPPSAFAAFDPSQLRTAYQVPAGLTGKGRTAAIIMAGERVSNDLVNDYARYIGSSFDATTQLTQAQIGPNNTSEVSFGEAMLDVTTIIGMAPDIDHITILNAPPVQFAGATLIAFPYALAAALDPANTNGVLPDVINMSFGSAETYYNLSIGGFAAISAVYERVLLAAAAMGVTVAAASGDSGSISVGAGGGTVPGLAVSFPASSPYVTAVGGTNLELYAGDLFFPDNTIKRSGVWNDYPLSTTTVQPYADVAGGGGGTSIIFEKPPWQDRDDIPGSRRALPDVSFLADLYPGTFAVGLGVGTGPGGQTGNGTSQASPIFVGLITLINQHLTESGKGTTVGLATPLLYELGRKFPAAYYDVDDGSNNITSLGRDSKGNPTVNCCYAGPGFDRASGWGSLLVDNAIAGWDWLDALAPAP